MKHIHIGFLLAALCVLIPSAASAQAPPGDASGVLVAGDPQLTQQTVDRFTRFIEWMIEVPLTKLQKDAIQTRMVFMWTNKVMDDIGGVNQILKVQDQLDPLDEGRRGIMRIQIRKIFMETARMHIQDPLMKLIVDADDAGHRPIAVGKPPLTRQSTDAFLELLSFIASEAANQKPYQPTQAEKDTFAKALADGYPKLPDTGKEQFAQIPLLWAAIRAAWNDANDEQKAVLRKNWADGMKTLAQQPQSQTPASSGTPSNQSSNESGDLAKLQKDRQMDQLRFQTLSNISRMNFETSMHIIRNMNPSVTYTYRYR